MKHLILILILTSFFYNNVSGQKKCEPEAEVFRLFQKNHLSLSIGTGILKNKADNNSYSFYTQLGYSYFPFSYLEIGARLRPTFVNSQTYKKNLLLERNAYLRYYAYRIPCYKTGIFGGLGIYRDGSSHAPDGKKINSKKLFSAFSFGLTALPKKNLQVEFYTDVFFNRQLRTNLSLNWHFLNIKLKSKQK